MTYPAYPRYKPSGVEWLGDVPEHWDLSRLKEYGTLVAGSGFPHEYQGVEGEALQFYKVGDLAASSDGQIMGPAPHTISRQTAAELRARVIPQDSVIYQRPAEDHGRKPVGESAPLAGV